MFGPQTPNSRKELGRYLALSQVGFEMVVPGVIGLLIDRWFGSFPWGVIVGVVLGFVAGLVHLVHLTKEEPPDRTTGRPGG